MGKKIDEADKSGWNKNDSKPQMDELRKSCDWDCKVAQKKKKKNQLNHPMVVLSSSTRDWKKNELQTQVVHMMNLLSMSVLEMLIYRENH